MGYYKSNHDVLVWNGSQHDNKLWNIMEGNKSDYDRNKFKGTEWIT